MAQKIIRGYLARKQHRPRYKGLAKINELKSNLSKTKDIVNQLKNDKDLLLRQLSETDQLINSSIMKIKSDPRIKAATIDQLYADVVNKVNLQNRTLNSKLQVY